jgi:hypothetical protein
MCEGFMETMEREHVRRASRKGMRIFPVLGVNNKIGCSG